MKNTLDMVLYTEQLWRLDCQCSCHKKMEKNIVLINGLDYENQFYIYIYVCKYILDI